MHRVALTAPLSLVLTLALLLTLALALAFALPLPLRQGLTTQHDAEKGDER